MTTNELIELAKAGNINARNEVWVNHLHVVERVLYKLREAKSDIDTKRYGALLGILSAIYNFRPECGSFENYAFKCAYRKAQRIMSQDWIVRVPNGKMNKFLSNHELPYKIVNISAPYFSYCPEFDCDSSEILSPVESELVVRDETVDTEAKKYLKESIEELTPLEQDAIYYEYGYISSTLREVGEKHGVSHEWVRLKTNKAFKKLKKIYINKLKQKVS